MSDTETKPETTKFAIGSSQAYGSSHRDTSIFGTAKFTVSDYEGPWNGGEHYSVEVRATFDPETKTWSAEIVKQWKGRF